MYKINCPSYDDYIIYIWLSFHKAGSEAQISQFWEFKISI